jgi:hypothetical protein
MTEHDRRRPLFVDDVTDPGVWEAAAERRALAASARRSFARRTADHLGDALGVSAAPRLLLDSGAEEQPASEQVAAS